MQNPKVIIDTNVIVAASIIENVDGFSMPIKHDFYDHSVPLFSLFKKRSSEKIGIVLPKVKSEAFGVLSRAIKKVFLSDIKTNASLKQYFYDSAVAIISSSEHRMRTLFRHLVHEWPHELEVQKHLKHVVDMTESLKKLWLDKYSKKPKRIHQSKERTKPIASERYWKGEQKDEVFYTHASQVNLEAKQLERFMKKYPNRPDQRVLAEAIAVKSKYCQQDRCDFLLASWDSGFFSPYTWMGTRSDLVTKEIEKRFDIICDQPLGIYRMLGGYQLEDTQ